MIVYLVATDHAAGRDYARERGWAQIAANRFVRRAADGERKDDIRIVKHIHEIIPLPTGTYIIRGLAFGEHHDRERIEALVSTGGAQWHE